MGIESLQGFQGEGLVQHGGMHSAAAHESQQTHEQDYSTVEAASLSPTIPSVPASEGRADVWGLIVTSQLSVDLRLPN